VAAIDPAASLRALFAACAALHTAPADAQSSGDADRVSLRLHDYAEASFSGPHLGAAERYQVQTAQAGVALTVRGGFVLDVNALAERMSGASPWFVLPDAQGRPLQVLSGASIADHRRELAVALGSPRGAARRHTLHAQVSDEDDYHAVALGYEQAHALDGQRTLTFGVRLSDDRIEPTDARLYDRIERADKHSAAAFAAATLVLDRNRQLQVGASLEHADGYLSDPYKQVLVDATLQRDARPGSRLQGAVSWRYRQALRDGRSALHLDYRLSQDDWGVRAHALEAAWIGEFGDTLEFGPRLRYYSQDAARFYAPFFVVARADGHASCDYRLGRFGAFSLGVDLTQHFGDIRLRLSAEHYRSATDYALGGRAEPVPGLVDYTRLSLGLDWMF